MDTLSHLSPDFFQISYIVCREPEKIFQGWGADNGFFLVIDVYTEGHTNLPGEAIGPKGSLPEFLRKPIATFDFPGWGGVLDPLSPSGSAHVYIIFINLSPKFEYGFYLMDDK